MQVERLQSVYMENDAVRAVCDNLAGRTYNQNETTLRRMLHHLEREGWDDIDKSDVIGAFRQLEDAGCGRYVEGRHGWPSRFVWEVKSSMVANAAKGVTPSDAVEVQSSDPEDYENEMIEHTYVLRPDLTITLELPENLTCSEANRLSSFVGSLSFDD